MAAGPGSQGSGRPSASRTSARSPSARRLRLRSRIRGRPGSGRSRSGSGGTDGSRCRIWRWRRSRPTRGSTVTTSPRGFAEVPAGQVTGLDLAGFLRDLRGRGLSRSSVTVVMSVLRDHLGDAAADGVIPAAPKMPGRGRTRHAPVSVRPGAGFGARERAAGVCAAAGAVRADGGGRGVHRGSTAAQHPDVNAWRSFENVQASESASA
jgi:hypothetical protein